MKGRAQARLLCSTQADAEFVRDQMQQWLDGRADRWQVEGIDPFVSFSGLEAVWQMLCDVSFNTPQGADELLAWIESRWNSGPIGSRLLPGSKVRLHDCEHDIEVGFCSTRTESVKT
jgi:hypothetical protein